MTAYGKEDAKLAAEDLNVGEFLTKPVLSKDLVSATYRSLGIRQSTPEKTDVDEVLDNSLASLQGANILVVEENDLNQ